MHEYSPDIWLKTTETSPTEGPKKAEKNVELVKKKLLAVFEGCRFQMGSLGGFSLLRSGWFDGCLSALYGGNTCAAQVPKLQEVERGEITKSGCKTSGDSCEL